MSDYKEFFNKYSAYFLQTIIDCNECDFEIEDLYQAFKERMIEELVIDNPDLRVYGVLKDISEDG